MRLLEILVLFGVDFCRATKVNYESDTLGTQKDEENVKEAYGKSVVNSVLKSYQPGDSSENN